MRVYKYMKKNREFTSFDNRIMTISREELADGAKILYVFLGGYKTNGKSMTRNYIMKCLSIAESTYKKYMRQLKRLDLVIVARVGAKDYECYVGTTSITASKVKEFWKVLDSHDAPTPLTLEDLENIRKKSCSSVDGDKGESNE